MKKIAKKLNLHRETLRRLDSGELRNAAGGNTTECPSLYGLPRPCGPLKDTGEENE